MLREFKFFDHSKPLDVAIWSKHCCVWKSNLIALNIDVTLFTILQKENAGKSEISEALVSAVSALSQLDETQGSQVRQALLYFIQLILHRRSADEREDLIELIKRNSRKDIKSLRRGSVPEPEQLSDEEISPLHILSGTLLRCSDTIASNVSRSSSERR